MAEIFIVEDDPFIRKGLKIRLEEEGYAVMTAVDGEDALAKLPGHSPDLVLLDVRMPKMNGFRFCERFRELDKLTPIIFLTANPSEADQVRALGLGADDYLQKDVPPAILLARIRRAIARGEQDFEGFSLGAARVDFNAHQLVFPDKGVSLTRTEEDILRVLYDARRVLSADELLDALRGRGFACTTSVLYTHFHNLRQKLESAADRLVGSPKVGYRLLRKD